MWDIKISAHENRGQYPYAEMTVSDRLGRTIYKTIVKVSGTHRMRSAENGDTPVGEYRILEWRKTGNNRYNISSFGPNDLLALEYIGEEGKGRYGLHVHGGGRQENSLMGTFGCIRINNDDIAELKQITDKLEESDSLESKGSLTVYNDLETPLKYDDRITLKDDWERYLGELPPAYVTQ